MLRVYRKQTRGKYSYCELCEYTFVSKLEVEFINIQPPNHYHILGSKSPSSQKLVNKFVNSPALISFAAASVRDTRKMYLLSNNPIDLYIHYIENTLFFWNQFFNKHLNTLNLLQLTIKRTKSHHLFFSLLIQEIVYLHLKLKVIRVNCII